MKWATINISAILLLLPFISNGACDAFFAHSNSESGLEIEFVSLSSSDDQIIQYYWDLGDGFTKTAESFTYTYQHPGIFEVSLTIITLNSCSSSFQKTIYVGVDPSSDTCNIEIEIESYNATFPEYNNGWISVNAPDPLISYEWSTGDNYPLIDTLVPGFYTLTLTNTDGCIQTEVIEIGYNNNCFASFYIDSVTYYHAPGAYRFQNTSTGEIRLYSWDFGDGTFSNLRNPLHVYDQPGAYDVCLMIFTDYQCSHFYCSSITVNAYIPPLNIHGNIYAGASEIPNGMVVLYEKQNNKFRAIKRSEINNGTYYFDSLNFQKNYLIHAIPYFSIDEIFFPKYLPTYYGNSTKWQMALETNLPLQLEYNISLNKYSEIYYGNGCIDGSVFLTEESFYSKPIFQTVWFDSINSIVESKASNIIAILENEYHDIIDFRITNNLGNYKFNNLPWGNYIIRCEKAGMLSQELEITLNENTPSIIAGDLIINSSTIHTDVLQSHNKQVINIFPNPATDYIFIVREQSIEQEIKIFGMDGKLLKTQTLNSTNNKIDIRDLSTGAYMLVISGNNKIFTAKMLKKP